MEPLPDDAEGGALPSEEASSPSAEGPRLIALIPANGREPSASLPDAEAIATWAAVSSLWHPALLARVAELPRIEDVEDPTPPMRGDIRLIPAGTAARLPSGYRVQMEDTGALLIEAGPDREATAREILARLDGSVEEPPSGPDARPVLLDFLALGTASWWLRDLTIAMGHFEALDRDSLTREVLAGARAWRAGDPGTAVNRLRAAFELLTQGRERFYPVDAYLIDLCLLDPSTPPEALAETLAARAPVTFLAPARAIEALAGRDPAALAVIREAVTEGWGDVVGGAYDEVDEPLRPVESILWQFRHGAETYRRLLDNRTVETLARRRFGLYPQLPQLAKRFGFRYALHLGLDQGKFPVPSDVKRLWESPDGSVLEALVRPPQAGDRAAAGLLLPWRLARTMKDDHVATFPLAHWPEPVAPWFRDLRRVAQYSPVLARWVTLSEYFHLTDRPFESLRPPLDDYQTPYLSQAVARGVAEPISRRARHARLRHRFDGLGGLRALVAALWFGAPEGSESDRSPAELEADLECDRLDEVEGTLEVQEPLWAGALARGILGGTNGGRPGFLVLNPAGVARRAAVLLPEAALDLRPEGPLRAAQFTEEGVLAVVELPAFGYAWVPAETAPTAPFAPTGGLSAQGRTLRNEAISIEVDEATGGLRSIKAPGEPAARLGQQLVITGLVGPDGEAVAPRMRGDRFEVDYGGPALLQASSYGSLVDPRDNRPLAAFRQRYRLWSGRPMLELAIELSHLDEGWLEQSAHADPWQCAICCRWAWPDPSATLRRTSLLAAETTRSARPETPDAIDITTRRQRTALLFGGLAHHQRHGGRMLDTLLIAGREVARRFELGVALDLEHPYQAALELVSPAYVVPTAAGPPRTGPAGWFFALDHKAVAVTHVGFADPSGGGRGWGVVLHLLETSGRPVRCRLRLFRNPLWARQTDFLDELLVELPIDGDSVLIDLTPNELARVDVTLG